MAILRALLIAAGLLYSGVTVAQDLEVDVAAVKTLVTEWNDAHTITTVKSLQSLYSDTVNFYGVMLSRPACMAVKQAMLRKQKNFKQVLKNELALSGYSNGVICCDFVKTVSHNGKSIDYNAYLIVKQLAGNYLIVGESYLTTDRKINNKPDLGRRVAIKDVKYHGVNNAAHKNKADDSAAFSTTILIVSLTIGLFGLLVAFRKWRTPIISKRTQRISKISESPNYHEIGVAFEKFIVQQFALRKECFTLLEWRGDKFHEGIFPKSSHHPDLEYEFNYQGFVRTFSVECKYRSRMFSGSIQLMDENNYRNYEAFHKNRMPVYIALGLRGAPNNPRELYLIPFQDAELIMSYDALVKYRKWNNFSYNVKMDRLI